MTNLKPIVQIFFNNHMNIWIVLVLLRDSWRKRLRGTRKRLRGTRKKLRGARTTVEMKVLLLP
jgi:hypothetical protein